jgi:DNA adenine methylase
MKMHEDDFIIGTVSPEIKNSKSIKPPFGYYGAKQRLASQIVKSLPPHNAWVEAFCGSAAVTLAKKPAPIEIINDIDGEIINLFDQIRNNTEELCRDIVLTPYARAEFQRAREETYQLNTLERARRFLITAMMTVNGTVDPMKAGFSFSQSYARGNREARVNRWYRLPDRIELVADRLRNARIENRDARELLKMFINRPATLVYLDPPYFANRSHNYRHDANKKDFHKELLNLCKKARCMILISGYDSELYNSILSPDNGWTRKEIETNTRGTSGRDYTRTEVLWSNKFFTKAYQTKRINIRLTKKEKTANKINPPRGK